MIESPVNANVWKVLVEEGQKLEAGQTVAILEAMKMEINVKVNSALAGATVKELLVNPGDTVDSGCPVIAVKKPA